MITTRRISRRRFLVGAAALAGVGSAPAVVRAQGASIRLGTLTPLTGAGGNYGPSMRKAMEWVAEQVDAAGGVAGRKLQLFSEDDQTNPEAAVRAARKLIDVDKVAAIMGTWASAVTTAVAPLCWESKTFLTTVSGSDTITQLPHQGYLIRTQPNTHLQIGKLGEFILSLGVKRVFVLGAQTPFAVPPAAVEHAWQSFTPPPQASWQQTPSTHTPAAQSPVPVHGDPMGAAPGLKTSIS